MVVSRHSWGQEPSDAVVVTRSEAFSIQYNFLWDWKPEKDVWPLTYGPGMLGAVAGLSGLLVNNHFRRWLRLGRLGRFSSYAPLAVIPALAGGFSHGLYVTRSIMMNEVGCPLCYELRSIGIQLGLGFVYPLILGPLGALRMAEGYRTYPVPRLLHDSREVFRLYKKFFNIGYAKFATLFALNFVAAAVLPYLEMQSHEKWLVALERMEQDFEKKVQSGEHTPASESRLVLESTEYPPSGATTS